MRMEPGRHALCATSYFCTIMEQVLNYINGELRQALGGGWLEGHAPAEGKVYAQIADSDAKDVDLAVEAAEIAMPAWTALGRQGLHDAISCGFGGNTGPGLFQSMCSARAVC